MIPLIFLMGFIALIVLCCYKFVLNLVAQCQQSPVQWPGLLLRFSVLVLALTAATLLSSGSFLLEVRAALGQPAKQESRIAPPPAIPLLANPAGDLRIDVISAYNLVVDSNVESPSTYAPEAFHIGAQFCNDGTNDLTDVVANIGNFDEIGSNHTPGVYPSRTHPTLVGTFSFTHEGSPTDATRIIGNIPAGECVTQYWLVSYPRLDDNGNAVHGPSIKPDDDLWLQYDIWATADDGGVPLTANETTTATMRNEISALANKIWPNGDNKVPDVYKNAIEEFLGWEVDLASGGSAAYPGESIRLEGVWYDLGNVGKGFDNDGDFVPDQNVWMQPVGDPALYNPGCFRLVHTYGIVIVKLKGGGEYLIPFEDQLYFQNIPDNTGAVGLVFYEFLALNGACTANISPYQEVASGADNEKFNGDYGHYVPPLVSLEPPLLLDKQVDQTQIGPALPATLTYSLAFTNPGPVDVGNLTYNMPLVVQESIPTGTTYVGGSADSNVNIDGGSINTTIYYSTDNGSSWSLTEPADPTTVTDIQWWLDSTFPVGASGSVTFEVIVNTANGPLVENEAGLSLGGSPPFVTDDANTFILGTNSIGDLVWQDDDNDATNNGGSEAGIPNITVNLYWDRNGDGLLDADDPLLLSDETDGGGIYGFNSLPDADYLVQVDGNDVDLPYGYVATTDEIIVVTGLSGSTTFDTADFGFGPALRLDKSLLNSPVYEGQSVIYQLDVTNTRPGSVGGACTLTTWASSQASQTDGAWLTPANAFGASELDGLYATSDFQTGSETIGGTLFDVTGQTGNIVSVEALFSIYLGGNGALSNDTVTGHLHFNNDSTPIDSRAFTPAEINAFGPSQAQQGLLTWNVTSAKAWNWADFSGNLDLVLVTDKVNADDSTLLNLDALGFRITTDEFCAGDSSDTITLVPLSDTYDADKLEFVSASTPETSLTFTTTPYANTGLLSWDNVGPLVGGETKSITVTFEALEPAGNLAITITNTAVVSGARFVDGSPLNNATDAVTATLEPTGSISGTLWSEGAGTTGWVGSTGYESGVDFLIPNITVTLYACLDSGGDPIYPGDTGRSCTASQNGGTWTAIGTQQTDANGDYTFAGLLDGYYYVTVDSAAIPGTATQSGDPDETPGVCSTCDDRWGNPANNLSLLGSVANASDTGDINFGYTVSPALYGVVWEDVDGDGVQDTNEPGIGGVTLELDHAGCTIGLDCPLATTDANGNYLFESLVALTDYNISVRTGTLPGSDPWAETGESDSTVNNDIAVTPQAGEISGSHDFGFHQSGTSVIGDTLYFDWDGDGNQDGGDEGIPNIALTLYQDTDGNGSYDAITDAFVMTTTTSITGYYQFTGLAAGDYLVVVQESDPDFPANVSRSGDPDESSACTICDGLGSVLALASAAVTDTVDFGYHPFGTVSIGDTVWYDTNGDGVQSGVLETGLANVTVQLWVDANNDGTYSLIEMTATDSSGIYTFDNLVDDNYRVVVDAADTDIPDDAFGNNYVSTTPITYSTTISNGNVTNLNGNACSDCNLDFDFGFTALGAVGDLIFWDANGNGEPDWNENGIANVTVTLTNTSVITTPDGTVWPVGAFVLTTTTAAGSGPDPAGSYLFTGLAPGDYHISADTGGPINGAAQTADPDRDGVTCTDNTYPSLPACDNATVVTLLTGTTFMGADMGYQAPGAFGDYIWFDQNGDGVQDGGESGISNLVVTATTIANVTINGVNFPSGTTTTTTTDPDGYYSFDNLISNGADATWTVTVEQPANMTPSTDPDGSPDATTTLTISTSGTVTSVGGTACTDCFLDVDFGFEMNGPYGLSGDVCLEAQGSTNGICGDGSDNSINGLTVSLYNDAGDFLGATTTNTSGIYTFTNLIDDIYIVVIGTTLPPLDASNLTTTASDTPATVITETAASAYQTVPVNASSASSDGGADANMVEGVDFAAVLTVDYDFGDLPQTYNTTLEGNPSGARHTIPMTPTLYLGSTPPDSEGNGVPSVNADSDGADEDGVTLVDPTNWVDGSNGGTIEVTVSGNGWLVGWFDFNDDGDLTDSGEMIVSQAVSTGLLTVTFDIPAGIISGGNTDFYSRFRLFEAQPSLPTLAYNGAATNGEVEDYFFDLNATPSLGDYLWLDIDGDGIQGTDPAEQALSGVIIDLYDTGGSYLSSTTTLTDGTYLFDSLTAGLSYTVQLSDTNFQANGPLFGYIPTTLGAGTAATDSNADANALFNGFGYAVTATTTSQPDLSFDFGLQPTVDLSLSKVVNNASPNWGDTITFTISISNSGVFTAENVFVSDPLPAGLGFVSATPDQGVYTNSTGLWEVGIVPTNTTLSLTLVTTVTNLNPITNAAQISSTNRPDPDSTPGNDLESEDDQDSVVITPQQADLSLTKTANITNPNVGDTITFTVVVSNAGPSDAANVVVADLLPVGLAYLSDAASQGVYTDSAGLWNIGTITNSTTATLTVMVTVTDTTILTNTAQITAADQFDPDSTPGNSLESEDDQDSAVITPISLGSIRGQVRDDTDNDGNLADADSGISGVTIELWSDPNGDSDPSDGISILTTMTDVTGNYTFTNVTPGLYVVVETDPSGYNSTADSDEPNDNTIGVTLTPGTDSTGNDFLDSNLADISGQVREDTDGDGDLADLDSGISGVTVVLWSDPNGDGDPVDGVPVLTTTTNITGSYVFTNITPADYVVVETDPSGYNSTADSDAPNDNTIGVTLTPGTDSTGNDFLDASASGQIGNYIWDDLNFDGIQDSGENGLSGVSVVLYDATNTPILTTTTNASGVYTFTNLIPGDYTVAVSPPISYGISPQDAGTPNDDTQDSDIDPTTGRTITISLTAGETDLTWDGGLFPVRPQLEIDKNDGGLTAVAGGLITYTLTYSNAGSQDATGVVITDIIPAHTVFQPALSSPGWACTPDSDAGSICTYDAISITIGSVNSITYVVRVDTPLPSGIDLVTNTTTISDNGSNGPDPTPTNNSDTETTPLIAQPDLQINKNSNQPQFRYGGLITYTLTYSNVGSQDATGVVITDIIPAHTVFQPALSSPGWVCNPDFNAGSLCTRIISGLPVGSSNTLTYVVRVDDPLPAGVTTITNSAVISDDGSNGPDPTPANNSDQATNNLLPPAVTLTKLVDVVTAVPNQVITYTLLVTNTGGATLNPVIITDTLPDGLTYDGSATPPPDSVAGQMLVWNDVTGGAGLPPGQSVQVTLRANITQTTGTYVNSALAEGVYPGGTVTDTDQAPVFVTDPTIDLDKEIAVPGAVDGLITFTITLSNTGPSVLDAIPLIDSFSGPLAYVGGTPPADSVDNNSGVLTWNDLTTSFGNVPPGQQIVVETVFRITTSTPSFSATNRAFVSGALDLIGNDTNDAEDRVNFSNEPTAVDLRYFNVIPESQAILLSWETALEYHNFGFRILRSESGDLATAQEIAFIEGQGAGTQAGAAYSYRDVDVVPNQTYTYWLVDIDLNGQETVHASGSANLTLVPFEGNHRLYLPLVNR